MFYLIVCSFNKLKCNFWYAQAARKARRGEKKNKEKTVRWGEWQIAEHFNLIFIYWFFLEKSYLIYVIIGFRCDYSGTKKTVEDVEISATSGLKWSGNGVLMAYVGGKTEESALFFWRFFRVHFSYVPWNSIDAKRRKKY